MQIVTVALHDLQVMIDRAAEKVITAVSQQKKANNEADTQDELLTVQDAANLLSLSVPTIYGLIHKGELPVMKRSKRCYFSKVELINYLKDGRKKTLAETAKEADNYLLNKKTR